MLRYVKTMTAAVVALSADSSVNGAPTIVQVLPLSSSGSAGERGQYYKKGYAMAVEEFNAAGGLDWNGNGTAPVTIETIDGSGAEELDAFLSDHPARESETNPILVLGGYGSSNIAKQINCTDTYGALFINGGGADAVMYYPRERGGVNGRQLAFGLLSSVERMAITTMDYLAERVRTGDLPKPLRIALLWEDKSHGWAYQQVITSYALAFPDLFTVAYASDFKLNTELESDFEYIAEDMVHTHERFLEIDSQGLGALLVDAHTEDFVKLQNVLSTHPFDFKFVTYGARGADPATVARLNDPRLNNNTVAAQWWNPVMNTDQNREFVGKWRLVEAYSWADELDKRAIEQGDSSALFELASTQLPVVWYGALGYATAKLALEALRDAPSQTRAGVKEHLQRSLFSTILPGGRLEFDDNGQARYQSTIIQSRFNKDGEPVAETLFPAVENTSDFQVKQGWLVDQELCSEEFLGSVTGPCDAAAKRSVRFFWVDHAGVVCADPQQPCDCLVDATTVQLPAPMLLECEYLPVESTNGTVVLVIASLGAVFCTLSLLIVLWSYNSMVMKAGQREFLAIMVWAGIWCNLTAIAYLGPNTDTACISRMFYTLLSLTFLIGSLTVKVYRIYKIWSNQSMKRIVVTTRDMFLVLAAIVLGIFVLFCVWMITGRPQSILEMQTGIALGGNLLFEYETAQCQYSQGPVLPSICIGYILMILLFCNVLSFQGRNSDSKFLESKSILMASYLITFVFTIVLFLAAGLELPASSLSLIIALGLVFSACSLISLVVGTKLYYVTVEGLLSAKRAVAASRRSTSKTTLNAVEEYMDATEEFETEGASNLQATSIRGIHDQEKPSTSMAELVEK